MNYPPSCRILVVSESKDHGRTVAHRIKTFSDHYARGPDGRHGLTIFTADNVKIGHEDHSSNISEEHDMIKWKISNRYYTADVHFKVIEVSNWNLWELEGVPAVIFAWSPEHPYKEHAKTLARDLEKQELEVALSVRASMFVKVTSDIVEDDFDQLEEFFSGHGLEFINGDSEIAPTAADESLEDELPQSFASSPGLPRAIDALSTIMWPSMVQSSLTQVRKDKSRNLMNLMGAEDEPDDIQSLMGEAPSSYERNDGFYKGSRNERIQSEMKDLERWLDGDDDPSETIFKLGEGKANEDLVSSPVSSGSATPTLSHSPAPVATEVYKFDDDFTEFVSAPHEAEFEHDHSSYVSLQSDADSEFFDNDPELPTHSEVKEISQKIFGHSGSRSASTPSSANTGQKELERIATEQASDVEEDPAFDLSRVLGALQHMKEEISVIKDEKERRKAAAKVALGLVYGLDGDGLSDDESGP